jgi:hypothetical protein
MTDIDHCLVVAEHKKRLSISRRAIQKFDMQRLHFKKINNVEFKEQYQVKFLNRFAALENPNYRVGINRVWGKNSRVNSKISEKRV